MSLLRIGALLVVISSSIQHNGWTVIGPGGGGAQFHPTMSPHDPNRVLVACDMTGSYLSEDGGRTWRMFNLGAPVRFFVFDRSNPNLVFAATGRLWRSGDGGRSWKSVYPEQATVELDGDHADERVASAEPSIDALDADAGVLMAAMGTSLKTSADGGRTWQPQAGSLPGPALHLFRNGDDVYVLGRDYFEHRRGSRIDSHPHPPFTQATAAFEGTTAIFYGIGGGALFTSHDGTLWSKAAIDGQVRAIAACRNRGSVAYASYQGRTFGVLRTSDAGRTWNAVWTETRDAKAKNVDNGWVSERFGPDWGEHPLSLGVGPSDPDQVYATDLGRTLRTMDGGRNWLASYTRRLPDGSYTSTGLDVTTTYGIHFDPFVPTRQFITYTDIGLFRSDNGGKGWTSATTRGVPGEWLNTTYWLAFDPSVNDRMWAVMSDTHDLPRPKMWRRRSASLFKGGIVQSDDGGRTWRALSGGLPQIAATHVLVDPRSPVSARVLYVTGFGKGVFKSVDGGSTWHRCNVGLPEPEPFAWRLTLDSQGALYLVLARRSEDGSIGNAGDGSLYRSTDGARSWSRVNLPEGVNGPNGLLVDPRDDNRLYLAAWARKGAANGGIYLSTDRGSTWKRLHDGDQHVYDVTFDPRHPDVLYATGFESAAWRSGDRGSSWHRIPGFDFKWAHRVIPDPREDGQVYITTFGGSVWHGPAR